MFVDEFYFHYRRGLPRWEKIGHPLDTLTVIGCFVFLFRIPPSPVNLILYGACVVVSSLFVTKDEFVHSDHCAPGEQWVHALLFLIHPIVLVLPVALWPALHMGEAHLPSAWVPHVPFYAFFLRGLLGFLVMYGLYQTIYWNWIWRGTVQTPKK